MALSKQKITKKLNSTHIAEFHNFLMSKISVYSQEFQMLIFQNLSQFFSNNLLVSPANVALCLSLITTAYRSNVMNFNSKSWSLWKECFARIEVSKFFEILRSTCTLYMKDTLLCDAIPTKCSELVILAQILIINKHNSFDAVLIELFDTAGKLSTNPYLSNERIFKTLCFVEIQLNKLDGSKDIDQIQELILSHVVSILNFIKQKISNTIKEDNELDQDIAVTCVKIIVGLLSISNRSQTLKSQLSKYYQELIPNLLKGLTHLNSEKILSLMQYQLLAAGIDFAISSYPLDDLTNQLLNITIGFERKDLAKLQASKSSKFNCDTFISSAWMCLDKLLCTTGITLTHEQATSLFTAFLSDVTMASNDTILVLTSFARHFVYLFKEDAEQINLLVGCMWKIINSHLRGGQCLWPIYKNCIQTILHHTILCSQNQDIVNTIFDSWEKIFDLAERKMAVASIAAQQYFSVWNNVLTSVPSNLTSMERFADIFVKLATFGPLRQKKEKPFHYLYEFLSNNDQFDCNENLKSFQQHDQQVRILFINFLLNLPNVPEIHAFVVSLIYLFVDFDQKIGNKKCYYINSFVHRQKLRCWQAVLVLLPNLPSDFNFQELLPMLFTSCQADNQISVRCFIEWTITLILLIDGSLIDSLLDSFHIASEKKIFSVTYILSTIIQLGKSVSDKDFKRIVIKSVPDILPWAQAQHLTSRVHAHVALEVIHKRINQLQDKDLLEKFHFLSYCFSLSAESTAAVKHRQELTDTFYVSSFGALKDLNLDSIFHLFLKNHSVLVDEWIPYHHFNFPESLCTNFPLLKMKMQREDHFEAPKKVKKIPSKGWLNSI